jgi:hypothetical protein
VYADVEALLVAYLAPLGNTGVELPNDVQSQVPFVQVTRIGGQDDYITDVANVDLDCFGTTRKQARDLSRAVQALMLQLRHTRVNGVLVDQVETILGPTWVDFQDEHLKRYVLTYAVSSRVTAQ